MKKPNFWTKRLRMCVCMCVQRETATLPSPTPYQATKGLLRLSHIMLSFGNGRSSEGLAATWTHANTPILVCTLGVRHTHSAPAESTH